MTALTWTSRQQFLLLRLWTIELNRKKYTLCRNMLIGRTSSHDIFTTPIIYMVNAEGTGLPGLGLAATSLSATEDFIL